MRHQHRFVATPITGQNAGNGKEALFGWRVECDKCHKIAKDGDIIEEIRASWFKEIVPKSKLVHIPVKYQEA